MPDLTPKEERFVDEYQIDLNQTQAAIRAGFSEKSAHNIGYELMRKPEVIVAIAAKKAERAAAVGVTQEWVLRRLIALAGADPSELTEYRRVNCRHCWGEEHGYQETLAEHEERLIRHENEEEAAAMLLPPMAIGEFDRRGGIGFDRWREPCPTCPECSGVGEGRELIKDTRYLSEGGKALYAGVKTTREGVEVKTKDQTQAMQLLMRHMGMLNDKVKVDVGGTIHVHIDGNDADL